MYRQEHRRPTLHVLEQGGVGLDAENQDPFCLHLSKKTRLMVPASFHTKPIQSCAQTVNYLSLHIMVVGSYRQLIPPECYEQTRFACLIILISNK
jgi:hypothetical protein